MASFTSFQSLTNSSVPTLSPSSPNKLYKINNNFKIFKKIINWDDSTSSQPTTNPPTPISSSSSNKIYKINNNFKILKKIINWDDSTSSQSTTIAPTPTSSPSSSNKSDRI